MSKVAIILLSFFFLLTSAQAGFEYSLPQTSFVGGELSPLIYGRFDLAQYSAGFQTLQNFLVIKPGVVTRRPGTKYVATTQGNGLARLSKFVYSEDDAYVQEWTNLKLRFFRNQAQILSGGNPYEITTVFETSELFEFQSYQSADVMYLTHPNHPMQKLTRTAHASWTIADVDIDDGPFLDENITDVNITPSATTGSITLIARVPTGSTDDQDIFESGHVGSLWAIDDIMPETRDVNYFDTTGEGDAILCPREAEWEFRVYSAAQARWWATVQLQISRDGGTTWDVYAEIKSDGSAAVDERRSGICEEDTNIHFRAACTAYTQGVIRYILLIKSYQHRGVVRITAYTDANEVVATVLSELVNTDSTTRWSEGAWNGVRGYPACIGFNSGRIVAARTNYQPLTIWMSHSGDYEQWWAGTTDNRSYAYTLSMAEQNPINWIASQHKGSIIIGTLGGVMELWPLDTTKGFIPANPPTIHSSVAVRAKYLQPILADNTLIFVSQSGKQVHQLLFSEEQGSVIAPELTMLAGHITGDGLNQIAYQHETNQILWTVREDGHFPAMTYSHPYNIAAWSDHVTDGNVVSVVSIPNTDDADEVWMVCQRAVGGSNYYFVEYLDSINPDHDIEDGYYLDCGASWDGGDSESISNITSASPGVLTLSVWPSDGDGTAMADGDYIRIESVAGTVELNGQIYVVDDADSTALTLTLDDVTETVSIDTTAYTAYTSGGTVQMVAQTYSGLSQWAGETVAVLADGGEHDDELVTASGTVTLNDYYNTVHAGLNYTSTIKPMPAEIITRSGITSGKTKTLKGIYLNLYKSCAGQYGIDENELYDLPWYRDSVADTDTTYAPPLLTGSLVLESIGGYQQDLDFIILQAAPWPMTIRAIVPIVEFGR